MSKLKKIEKRIIEIKKEVAGKEQELGKTPMTMERLKGQVKVANKPLIEELDQLETQRRFILDRRTKTILFAGLIVSIITVGINIWLTTISANQQIIIKQDIDNLKSKSAEIGKLIVEEFTKKCPLSTATTSLEFQDGFTIKCISSE